MIQNRFGGGHHGAIEGLKHKTIDEKWTRSPSHAHICHPWHMDGMLIRKQAKNVEHQSIQAGPLLGKDGINLSSRSGD